MDYWIIENEEQVGPLSIDALKELGITPSTPVWHDGLTDWLPASSLPELQPLFVPAHPIVPVQPPVVPQQGYTPAVACVSASAVATGDSCPPNYLVWAIIVTVLCCLPLGIPAIIYAAKVKSYYRSGNMAMAHKASERAALFVILSFVLGLIAIPFQMVMQMI